MTTAKEIKEKYQKQHDDLTAEFYTRKRSTGVTPEEQTEFDQNHAKVWDDMHAELLAGGFIQPAKPVRDLEAEIDAIKAQIGMK